MQRLVNLYHSLIEDAEAGVRRAQDLVDKMEEINGRAESAIVRLDSFFPDTDGVLFTASIASPESILQGKYFYSDFVNYTQRSRAASTRCNAPRGATIYYRVQGRSFLPRCMSSNEQECIERLHRAMYPCSATDQCA